MNGSRHLGLVMAVGLALGVAAGCAGKRKASQNPAECMNDCDQDECQFKAQSVGDNADYLECLKACEAECNPGGVEGEDESE